MINEDVDVVDMTSAGIRLYVCILVHTKHNTTVLSKFRNFTFHFGFRFPPAMLENHILFLDFATICNLFLNVLVLSADITQFDRLFQTFATLLVKQYLRKSYLEWIFSRGHSNYQIGPNLCKSDQIGDTYYQNQGHFIRFGFGSS